MEKKPLSPVIRKGSALFPEYLLYEIDKEAARKRHRGIEA
jgi:hypothetical protein